jgi:hypothetical protein
MNSLALTELQTGVLFEFVDTLLELHVDQLPTSLTTDFINGPQSEV